MDYVVLAALAEPNRLRIVELLNRAPRWVGEIATELGLRQPQVTKHLQTLQHAGLVTMHPLGQRRIYALRREPLRELRQWLDALNAAPPEEHTLERYVAAIASERAQAARDPGWAIGRRIRLQRQLPAPASEVWAHWTSPALVRQWWSPEHFDVAECAIDPVPGGRLEITMRAPDGGRYPSRGHFLTVTPPGGSGSSSPTSQPTKRPCSPPSMTCVSPTTDNTPSSTSRSASPPPARQHPPPSPASSPAGNSYSAISPARSPAAPSTSPASPELHVPGAHEWLAPPASRQPCGHPRWSLLRKSPRDPRECPDGFRTRLLGLAGISGTLLDTAVGAGGTLGSARINQPRDRPTWRSGSHPASVRAPRARPLSSPGETLPSRSWRATLSPEDSFDPATVQALLQHLDEQRDGVARAVGAVAVEGPNAVAHSAEYAAHDTEELAGRLRDWLASIVGGEDREALVQSQLRLHSDRPEHGRAGCRSLHRQMPQGATPCQSWSGRHAQTSPG